VKTTEELHATIPLAATFAIRVLESSAERVELEMDWRADLATAAGVLHGGALMALADTAGALCAFANLPSGATTATTHSATNLLSAVREGTVGALSTPLRAGRRDIVVETELRDSSGRLVAKTTQIQAVLEPRAPAA
jgi:1,4-dihydroxy-2-naphthoyl-CoA hydrolase